ncbi:MAG: hypothetical protein V1645_04630 [archaeon]
MGVIARCKCPNNGLFVTSIVFLIVFLGSELMFRMYDLYRIFPEVDIISHLLSGMTLGAGIYWIFTLNSVRKKALMAVFFTFVVGVIWEILEMLEEKVVPNPPWLRDYFFYDGAFDILVMVIGSILAIDLIYMLRYKTKILE